MQRQKYCDATRRPIAKDSLLSYTRSGITYLARVVDFLEDLGETESYKWIDWNYTPGVVLIELLETPWDSDSKINKRIVKVDTRSLVLIKTDILFPQNM